MKKTSMRAGRLLCCLLIALTIMLALSGCTKGKELFNNTKNEAKEWYGDMTDILHTEHNEIEDLKKS